MNLLIKFVRLSNSRGLIYKNKGALYCNHRDKMLSAGVACLLSHLHHYVVFYRVPSASDNLSFFSLYLSTHAVYNTFHATGSFPHNK